MERAYFVSCAAQLMQGRVVKNHLETYVVWESVSVIRSKT